MPGLVCRRRAPILTYHPGPSIAHFPHVCEPSSNVSRGLASNILGAGNIYLSIHQPAPRPRAGLLAWWMSGRGGSLPPTSANTLSGLGGFVGEAKALCSAFISTMSAGFLTGARVGSHAAGRLRWGCGRQVAGRGSSDGADIFHRSDELAVGEKGRTPMGSCKVRHVRHTLSLRI